MVKIYKILFVTLLILMFSSIVSGVLTNVNMSNGTFTNTSWNGTFVNLTTGNTSGIYESEISYSSSATTNWTNISWWRGYGRALTPSGDTNVVNAVNYSGLISYWSLDNTTEDVVNGYNFTNYGMIGSTTAKINKSYDTSSSLGDKNMCYNDTTGVFSFGNGTTDRAFSVCLWFKPRALDETFYISRDLNPGGRGWSVSEPGAVSDGIQLTLVDNSEGSNIGRVSSASVITDTSKWYFFCGTYNGSGTQQGINIYLQGINANNGFNNFGIYTAMENVSAQLCISDWDTDSDLGKDAFYDEVSIWNRTLSPTEIENLYIRGATKLNVSYRVGNTSFDEDLPANSKVNLVSYWNLDQDGDVTGFYDSKGINNLTEEGTLGDGGDGITGIINYAILPNNNDEGACITDANQTGLNPSNNMTISTWVRRTTSSVIQHIVNKHITANRAYYLALDGTGATACGTAYQPLIVLAQTTGTTSIVACINYTIPQETWTHITITYDGVAGELKGFVNGDEKTVEIKSGSVPPSLADNTADFCIGHTADNQGKFNGRIDEVGIWNRTLSSDEIRDIYNYQNTWDYTNLGVVEPTQTINKIGKYIQTKFVFTSDTVGFSPVLYNITYDSTAAPSGIVNTSYLAVGFNITDFSFSSTAWETIETVEFNTSSAQTSFGVFSSFETVKTTVPLTSIISMRYYVDNISNIIVSEVVRTVSSTKQPGVSGLTPAVFSVAPGQHNLTIQVSRTGSGNVEINNFDFTLGQFESPTGNIFNGNLSNINTNFSVNARTTVLNLSLVNCSNCSKYFGGSFKITSDANTNVSCQFLYANMSSPYFTVYVQPGSTRGVGLNYISPDPGGQENVSISCFQDGNADVNITGAFINTDMVDNESNPVNFNSSTNSSTNVSNTVLVSGNNNILTSLNLTILNGTGPFVSVSISTASVSGAQTPLYYLEVVNSIGDIVCSSLKNRYHGNGDRGNIFMYPVCGGLTVGQNYTFRVGVNVSVGETLEIYDESLSVFETTPFDIATLNTPPIVSILTPINGDSIMGFQWINWTTTDEQSSRYLTNITLGNGTNYSVASNLNDSVSSYYWNTSAYNDGVYNLTVESCENETTDLFCGSDIHVVTIANSGPVINIVLPVNGSTVAGINFTLNVTNSSFVDTWWYSLNGGANTTFTPNITILYTLSGSVTIDVYANNSMGIVSSDSVTFNFLYNPIEDVLMIVEEIKEELKVIGSVIVLVAMIVFFAWLAWNDKFWITKWVATAFAFIQGLVALGVIYANSLGYSYSELLRINFWILGIVGFGMLMINLAVTIFLVMTPEVDQGKENSKMDTKWSTGKWER